MIISPGCWAVVQTVGRNGLSFLTFLVLSRLLEPKDFGLLGMAMAWLSFVGMFSEVGFSAAIIQKENIREEHFSSTFLVNIALGVLLTFVGVGISFPAAVFFSAPEIQPLIMVLSLGFVLNSLSSTQMAIAQREFEFRKLAIRDLTASIAGGVIGIYAAFRGLGVWSLVVQILTTGVVSTFLLWRLSAWRPNLQSVRLDILKELWPYSSKIFQFNLFKYFAQNTDKLIIGFFLGPVALGLYVFTFNIIVIPVTTIVGAVGSYLFPKYSRIQGNIQRVKSLYLEDNGILGAVFSPLLVVVLTVSIILVPPVFDGKWNDALELFPIMTIVAFFQIVISPVGSLLKSLNKPDWLLKWSALITVMVAASMMVGMRYGVEGIAFGLLFAYLVGFIVNMYMLSKIIYIKNEEIVRTYMYKAVKIVIASGLLYAIVKSRFLLESAMSSVGLVLITVIYLVASFVCNRDDMSLLYVKLRS